MLPPSDSISHHSRKLAEFAASLQNRSQDAAPPPYTSNAAATPAVPINEDTFGTFDDAASDESLDAQPAPININIDASITIDGEANTVVIPPSPSTGQTVASSSSSSSSSSTSPASSEASSPTSISSTSSTPPVQQLQQRQRTKSAMLAQSIISTLQASGALEDMETGKQRPLDVSVKAGVNIKGARNVVCLGVPATVSGQSQSPEDTTPSRKRRASEPIESPNPKRPLH